MRQIYKSKQNKAKGRAKYEVKEEGRRAGDRIVGMWRRAYQIIVADAADAVSVNFSGRCKFLQI